MEFSFHPAEGGAPVLGLHERGTFDRVFAVEDCVLPSERTVAIARLTQAFAAEHRWSAYHPARHTGVVRYLVVRHLAHSTNECAVHLIAASDAIPGLDEWARAGRHALRVPCELARQPAARDRRRRRNRAWPTCARRPLWA
jgi:tRNA/tmRNA/rRNA uracil-C5-methylase (TrmA/RlmC/RlmD family)